VRATLGGVPAPIRLDQSTVLRLVAREDGPALSAAYRRNRRHLAPWEPLRSARFFEAGGQTDAIADALFAHRSGSVLPLVLVQGEEIVGRITLSNILRGAFESAEMGYWLDARLEGRGVMTRAVGAAMGIAGGELGLHRVQAGTLLHNRGSQTVLERNGFERIDVARRYLRIAGEWQDHVLFQRLLEHGPDTPLTPPEGPQPPPSRLV